MIPSCILVIEDEDDRAFMTALYLNYRKLMYREIIKITRSPWDADDVLHTTVERLIDKVADLRTKDEDRLVSYILAACRNNAFNHLRGGKRRSAFAYDDLWDRSDEDSGRQAMDERLVREWEISALARVWSRLDDRTRAILESRYILGKSDAEMAAELHISPGSVRMVLTRARRTARRLMEEEEDGGPRP